MKKGLRNLLVVLCSAILVPALSIAILFPAAAALSSCSGDIQEMAEELDAEMQAIEAQGSEKASLQGKTVSLLGDSITTFEGYIPEGYLAYYPGNGMTLDDVNDTWWMKMLESTGMELLVNGSWSGSLVCGDSTAEDSKAGCSYRRLMELKRGDEAPDVILIYMGANDYFAEKELGVWNGEPTVRQDGYIQNFTESYELMLQKLLGLYPDTQLYCMTLIEAAGDHPHVNAVGCTISDYNTRIRQLAEAYGIPLIDLHECGMPLEEIHKYTDDGIHPNAAGAEKMAEYVTAELLRMNQ